MARTEASFVRPMSSPMTGAVVIVGSTSTKMASTSAAVKNAPAFSTHLLRCRRAKTCFGRERSCWVSHAGEIQEAHWPREEKYQSGSRSARLRTSQGAY
jgi:hypothetical protein